MPKKLDLMDLRILEGLGIYGPRNISRAARKLGLKTDTLRKRLRRMSSRVFLRFRTNIYCTNLGLKKAVVMAEAIPGYEDLLLDCLKVNDFWIYIDRCYGRNEGCIAYYNLPNDHCADFERFMEAIEKMGVARHIQIFWTTCFQGVNSKTKWFDEKSKQWVLSWDEWFKEIPAEDPWLPRTLIDPEDYPLKGDEIDVLVLKEMEKNPRVSLSELAEVLGVSKQVLQYHYRKHILERDLIEGFEVLTFHFDMSVSDMFVFVFRFDDMEKCAKFAVSLLDKPFVGGLGKILNENSLIVDIYLPKLEFRKFVDTLSKLRRADLLLSYDYIILDLRKSKRQTIPYKNFKKGSWVYSHNKHIHDLKDLVKAALPQH